MSKFILSGFSDEISANIDEQFEGLKKLGINFFEPRGIDGENISEISLDKAREVKDKMDKSSIRVSSVGSPVGKINIKDEFSPHLSLLSHVMDVAEILDTKYIRVFSFYVDGEYEKNRDEVIKRMRAMTAFAEKRGFILLHENEKGIYGDNAQRCADILKSVNSESLRAVFDFANFVQVGQKVYPDAFEMLLPYIEYVHIKDACENGVVVPCGYGMGNIKEVLCRLSRNGYEGFLSLEPHLGDFNGFSALEEGDTSLADSDLTPFERFETAHDALLKVLKKVEK